MRMNGSCSARARAVAAAAGSSAPPRAVAAAAAPSPSAPCFCRRPLRTPPTAAAAAGPASGLARASPPRPASTMARAASARRSAAPAAAAARPCGLPFSRRLGRPSPALVAAAAAADPTACSFSPVARFDFLVIGSGIAGLSYALKVADHGTVAIVTKAAADEGCTRYAQGGVCAALDPLDSPARHAADTRAAGAGLCDGLAVDAVCREGAARVLELVALGAEFTLEEEDEEEEGEEGQASSSSSAEEDGGAAPRRPRLHLTREGGHSRRRVVHAADATGAEIERALLARARAHPGISFFEHHLALDLVRGESAARGSGARAHCLGADVLDLSPPSLPAVQGQGGPAPTSPPPALRPRLRRFLASATLLASGGAGQAYPNTTNPRVATGDGVAMAWRAGAVVSNMEFVQFHPTALYTGDGSGASSSSLGDSDNDGENSNDDSNSDDGCTFLISEAVRGEGGRLLDARGDRFMRRFDGAGDPEGMSGAMELAPRDVVARAIHAVMREQGLPHVWLDVSHLPRDALLRHFPTIAAACRERLGLDISREPIPVVPAQHYMVGGVAAGLRGETSVQGLFACGEVACSGLHGANRLASNSLLEGLVFADRAAGPAAAHAEYARVHCAQATDAAEREALARHAAAEAEAAEAMMMTGAGAGAAASPSLPPAAAHLLAPALPADVARRCAERRAELRAELWRAAGIVRRTLPLERAAALARGVAAEARALRRAHGPGARGELVELENLAAVAELVSASAAGRKESRGAHYSLDWPETLPASRARPSLVGRCAETGFAEPVRGAGVRPALPALVVGSGGGTGGGGGGSGGGGAGASAFSSSRRGAVPAVALSGEKAPLSRALDVSVRAAPEDD